MHTPDTTTTHCNICGLVIDDRHSSWVCKIVKWLDRVLGIDHV